MEHIKCSETSAYKIKAPENYPEENIQPAEHCEISDIVLNTNLLSVSLNHTQSQITLKLDVIDNAVLAFLCSLFHLQSIFGEGGKRLLLGLLCEVEKILC
jgi:hypothetical protein